LGGTWLPSLPGVGIWDSQKLVLKLGAVLSGCMSTLCSTPCSGLCGPTRPRKVDTEKDATSRTKLLWHPRRSEHPKPTHTFVPLDSRPDFCPPPCQHDDRVWPLALHGPWDPLDRKDNGGSGGRRGFYAAHPGVGSATELRGKQLPPLGCALCGAPGAIPTPSGSWARARAHQPGGPLSVVFPVRWETDRKRPVRGYPGGGGAASAGCRGRPSRLVPVPPGGVEGQEGPVGLRRQRAPGPQVRHHRVHPWEAERERGGGTTAYGAGVYRMAPSMSVNANAPSETREGGE